MPNSTATLIFSDGATQVVDCRPYETVVQAAARQGLRLLVDCREGGCGTCKAVCHGGAFDLDDYSRSALTEAEAADGLVLTCRMRLDSPCVIEFDYPIAEARRGAPPPPRPVSIAGLRRVAADVVELTVAAEDGKPFDFLPGQYVNLQAPDQGSVRSYSFANEPGTDSAMFLIRLVPGGRMSGWLLDGARVGAKLLMSAPLGRFFLRKAEGHLLFVAGGTGLAPMLSMLERMRSEGQKPDSVTVVFGVNTPAALFHRDELDALLAAFPNSRAIHAVMSPTPDWTGAAGTAADVAGGLALDPATQAYVCGPPVMIDRTRTLLRAKGIPESAIFSEAFLPTSAAKAA